MKTFGKQALTLGGFYFIISSLCSLASGMLEMILFIGFIVMLIVLCFKKKYDFLIRFQDKFVKTTNYLVALGIAQYFSIIFMTIPLTVYGYKVAQARYNGWEIPAAPREYLQVVTYICLGILCLSLVVATVWNIKNKIKSSKTGS